MLELISIHIPKTGGRSFREILFQVYEKRKVKKLNRNELKTPKDLVTIDLLGSATILHGHLCYEQVRQLHLGDKARLVTWLRDPIERVFSNYCYSLRRTLQRAIPSFGSEITLENFVRRSGQRNQMSFFLEGLSLSDLFFVGLTEYFSTDVRDLGRSLNWQEFDLVRVNENKNFKRKISPLSPSQRSLIKELNEKDLVLYQEAINIRKERLKI